MTFAKLRNLQGLAMLALPVLMTACSSGQAGDPANRGSFDVSLITTGLGQIYPYRIRQLNVDGTPSNTIVDIVKKPDLVNNVNANNGVLPVAAFGTTALLPNGNAGNQYLMVRFSHKLKPESILSDLPAAQSNSGLSGTLQVLVYDPVTEVTTMVPGRGFVGGYTYLDDQSTPTLDLKLVQAVVASGSSLAIRDSRVNGFPAGFSGDQELVDDHVFVFVPDADANMSSIETFPTTRLIRILVSSGVQDYRNKPLQIEVNTATTVGQDVDQPQILGYSRGVNGPFEIVPGNNDQGVDPRTTILVKFSKPMQPRDVGQFFSTTDKTPQTRGLTLTLSQASSTYDIIYYADPFSVGNLCDYVVTPGFMLPGETPVAIRINTTIQSLTALAVGTQVTTRFTTGAGPGIINAPVAPEAIYIGIGGSAPGIAVLDLNGFGQGTGDPAISNWTNNPNVGQPGIYPPLAPGLTSFDGGGEGALTLTKDTRGGFRLLASPIISQVTDIHVGHPLDLVFNNDNINPNVTRANQVNPFTQTAAASLGNNIGQPPHPNPPRLLVQPPNVARSIFAEEPSRTSSGPPFKTGVVMTTHPPAGPCFPTSGNRLVTGNPFSTNPNELGIFDANFPSVFYGPQEPPSNPVPPTPFCPYTARQQVGHFLYIADRGNRKILVVNSNRFTVLESISLSDPTSMSVSPNLRLLAVSNFSSGTVSFIDIDPTSANFHTVKAETRVGRGPSGIAWQPEGEDLLVCNSTDNSVSIIGAGELQVRKTVAGFLNAPIDVAVTLRQTAGTGFSTGIYFAYILNTNGTVAVFESGPDGVNGIGFDDVVGIPAVSNFRRARTIQPDGASPFSACWIAHQDEIGLGQVSHMELTSSQAGPIPITPVSGGFILPPTFRQRDWSITGRIGGSSPTTPIRDRMSGESPVDIALDEIRNNGALPDRPAARLSNLYSAITNGKGAFKTGNVPAANPRFLFVALGDTGKLDVFEKDTGARVRTIDIPGIAVLSHYYRQ